MLLATRYFVISDIFRFCRFRLFFMSQRHAYCFVFAALMIFAFLLPFHVLMPCSLR